MKSYLAVQQLLRRLDDPHVPPVKLNVKPTLVAREPTSNSMLKVCDRSQTDEIIAMRNVKAQRAGHQRPQGDLAGFDLIGQ